MPKARTTDGRAAIDVAVSGAVQGVGFRDATRRRALELGLLGWVRNGDDDTVRIHAEGRSEDLDLLVEFLGAGPREASVGDVAYEKGKLEGHEQFAIRGVE
ncbi:MAG TPA: acylphosphatase, partial [Solirubrobacteraceae bacterium]|nr:acylphosphatase [Solirubrobacteraceae bacterium]